MNPRPGHLLPLGAVALLPGPVTAAWCPACKAWTRYEGQLYIVTEDGVEPVGGWAWCETCDPADVAGGRCGKR